jgi:hypothetical protein
MLLAENPLNSSPLIFPTLECFHIAGFIVAIGTTALVDFRLLDWGMLHQTPAEVAKDTGPWMLGGLLTAIFSGLGLYSSDPDMYYLNWSFLIKMACLVTAIVFNYTVHRKVVQSGASPGAAKLVGLISLALWVSIIFGGIYIAFITEGL